MNESLYITNSRQIFLLLPNVIGYFRISILIAAVFCIATSPLTAIILITISELLDAVDGYIARKFNQQSRFGTILDYTIDRITMASFLFALSLYYPQYWLVFCFLLILDISSHLFHLYLTHLKGDASHKTIDSQMPIILRWYYGNRLILFFSCLIHNLFLAFFLLCGVYPTVLWIKLFLIFLLPGFIFKTMAHIMQLVMALRQIAEIDVIEKNVKSIN